MQLSIIITGFYLSGTVIKSALTEWYNDPVITSLDSIAAPINSIQFPTVTVCRDETVEPPDNWAVPEILLNLLDFRCEYQNWQIDFGVYCNVTEPLRKDFQFLLKSVVDVYMQWLFEEGNMNNSQRLFHQKRYEII